MNYIQPILIEPPEDEPVTIAELRQHLRLDAYEDEEAEEPAAETAVLTTCLAAARQLIEKRLAAKLMLQTWQLHLPSFCYPVELPFYPISSIVFVKYLDTTNTLQTLDDETYELHGNKLVPIYNNVWPSTIYHPNAVQIEFEAGYESAADVPQAIKIAVLMLAGLYFEQREAAVEKSLITVPMAVDSLISAYRWKVNAWR